MGDSYHPSSFRPPRTDTYQPAPRHEDRNDRNRHDHYEPRDRNDYHDRYDHYDSRDRHDYRDYRDRRDHEYESYKPQSRETHGSRPPARNDFTFQPPPNAPHFPPASRNHVDVPHYPRRHGNGPTFNRGGGRGGGRGGSNQRGAYRGPVAAHDRALLQDNTLSRDEQFLGMASSAKFDLMNDVSGDEDEMNGEADGTADRKKPDMKKLRGQTVQTDGDAVPKWSNPDPYTSLPPPDESQKKKKDVVQLIRKAKIDQEKSNGETNAVTQNADFISFNFEDNNDGGESTISEADPLPSKQPFVGSLNEVASKSEFNSVPFDAPQRPWAPNSQPQNPKKRKKDKMSITGDVIEEWSPVRGDDSTPWCTMDHSRSATVSFWLHKEVSDFYDFVRPHEFERVVREDLIDRIEDVISNVFAQSRVMAFGSYQAGLYLPTADMDLVMISDTYWNYGPVTFGTSKQMHKLAYQLVRQNIAQDSVEVITKAKVPIIKFNDKLTGLKVDMSFDNISGVTANQTFQAWKEKYPAMPKIVTLIKHFLLMRGLSEVFMGGIGGFTVTCLVTHLLGMHPAVQSGNMNPDQHLGEILLDFFDLYGNKINFNNVALSMNPIKYEKKGTFGPDGKRVKPDRLCIIDPHNERNDISGGSAQIKLIFQLFSDAHRDLKRRMDDLESQDVETRKHGSILGCIFAGNYDSFRQQRDHLRRVHKSIREGHRLEGREVTRKPRNNTLTDRPVVGSRAGPEQFRALPPVVRELLDELSPQKHNLAHPAEGIVDTQMSDPVLMAPEGPKIRHENLPYTPAEERLATAFEQEFPAWPEKFKFLTATQYNALLIKARYGDVLHDIPGFLNDTGFRIWERAGKRKAKAASSKAATKTTDLTGDD